MSPDSHGVQEDVRGLVIHPLGRALEVALRNHTQEGLPSAQRYLVMEGKNNRPESTNSLLTSDSSDSTTVSQTRELQCENGSNRHCLPTPTSGLLGKLRVFYTSAFRAKLLLYWGRIQL